MESMDKMIRTEIIFGRDIEHFCGECRKKHRAYVSNLDWQEFKMNVIDANLDSFTIMDAEGTWMGCCEKVKILVVMWDPNEAMMKTTDMNNRFGMITDAYRRQFHQEWGEFQGGDWMPICAGKRKKTMRHVRRHRRQHG